MKNIKILSIAALIFVVTGISASCDKDPIDETPNLSELSGPYLGQTPPGNTPVKFAPNNTYLANSSWWWRSSPTFSPDGNEMYFTKYFNNREVHEVWYTKIINGQWIEPAKAAFSTSTYDSDVMFLQSNDTLYFYSRRPEGFIFRLIRTEEGWSEPVALNIPLPENSGIIISFYLTRNKTVYFSMLKNAGYDWSSADIYKSKFVNGQYSQVENIGSPVNINNIGEGVGYVDPNEKFIIYSSTKVGGFGWHDLYISYKNQDDTWNDPINLGSNINTSFEDDCPSLTLDGKYFFFTAKKAGDTGYTPYWVDAGFIEELKK